MIAPREKLLREECYGKDMLCCVVIFYVICYVYVLCCRSHVIFVVLYMPHYVLCYVVYAMGRHVI